jgi:hypothetical protein
MEFAVEVDSGVVIIMKTGSGIHVLMEGDHSQTHRMEIA